jgi:hypothetical protein
MNPSRGKPHWGGPGCFSLGIIHKDEHGQGQPITFSYTGEIVFKDQKEDSCEQTLKNLGLAGKML